MPLKKRKVIVRAVIVSHSGMFVADYHLDFRPFTAQLTMPVLFFYGKTDWMIGPSHYRGAAFPNMLLMGSDDMPFMENPHDLLKAIDTFRQKFNF